MIKDIYVYDDIEVETPLDLFNAIEAGQYASTLEEAQREVGDCQQYEPEAKFVIYKLSVEICK